jgi:hypothetical protein
MGLRSPRTVAGCCIQYLSHYPKEVEYLLPPLTFLMAAGNDPCDQDGVTHLELAPQIP